jgi:hypothetical protein
LPREQVRIRVDDPVVAHAEKRGGVDLEVQVVGVPAASPVAPTKPITSPAFTCARPGRAA